MKVCFECAEREAENTALRETLDKVRAILWPQRDFVSNFSELCDPQLAVNEALGVLSPKP